MPRHPRTPDLATAYARRVVAGKILAGPHVRNACARHLRDLADGAKRGLLWDSRRALAAIDFIESLKLTKAKWATLGLNFVLEPWQRFVVGSIWGWRRADGTRRFRHAYLEIPRKNGKTGLAAACLLLGGFFDDPQEYGAENYSAATKRAQAALVLNAARTMAKRAPHLRSLLHFVKARISCPESESFMEALGRDSENLDGLNPHFVVVDELHAHANSGIVDVLESATGARTQPFKLEITTAGGSQVGVCWDHHQHSTNVVDPESKFVDDAWFAYVCSFDEGDEWDDERTWRKANPNYGVSVQRSWFADALPRARRSYSARAEFLRKNLNVWTGAAEREIDLTIWDRGKAAIDEASLKGRTCYAGLDIGLVNDPSSLALVFPPTPADALWTVLTRHWIPEALMEELEKEHRAPWRQWVEQGLVTATPGDAVDDAFIEHEVAEVLVQQYGVKELAFDRHRMESLQTRFLDRGITMVAFGQGFVSMSPPTDKFLKLYLQGQIRHGGNPVLRWMAGNLVLRRDPANNLKPDKDKSRDKIDGVVAAIMGIGRAILATAPPENPYNERGVRRLGE